MNETMQETDRENNFSRSELVRALTEMRGREYSIQGADYVVRNIFGCSYWLGRIKGGLGVAEVELDYKSKMPTNRKLTIELERDLQNLGAHYTYVIDDGAVGAAREHGEELIELANRLEKFLGGQEKQ